MKLQVCSDLEPIARNPVKSQAGFALQFYGEACPSTVVKWQQQKTPGRREVKRLIRQAHKGFIPSGPAWLRKLGQLGLSQPCKAGSQSATKPSPLALQHHFVMSISAHDGASPTGGARSVPQRQRGQQLQLLAPPEDTAHIPQPASLQAGRGTKPMKREKIPARAPRTWVYMSALTGAWAAGSPRI